MKGTVQSFNEGAGYGNITGDDGKEYNVHYTALTCKPKKLASGQRVSFTTKLSGVKEAIEVKLLG